MSSTYTTPVEPDRKAIQDFSDAYARFLDLDWIARVDTSSQQAFMVEAVSVEGCKAAKTAVRHTDYHGSVSSAQSHETINLERQGCSCSKRNGFTTWM